VIHNEKNYARGDLVAKISWENRPLLFGVITEFRPGAGRARILSSNGHNWEYIHDIIPADEVPHRNK
jgi:hypothetical protein